MTDAPSVVAVDTRKHPRYKVTIPVDCSTRDLFLSNQVCNISNGGLFIRSETPLPLNAEVSLVLYLPATKGHIRATGRVAWNYDMEKHSCHVVRGSGIRFLGMSASDRATLESYLAGLTPAASAPPTPH
jgi:type IV pilus assembly protein PilZ